MLEPVNRETPLSDAQTWVTPNRLFFVRNHFEEPTIDPETWRLGVSGLVDGPLELSLEDIRSLPQRSLFATMECAGNSRSFLKEPVKISPAIFVAGISARWAVEVYGGANQ